MKVAVIYASKTGYSKKYAEWIKEALDADMFSHKNIKKSKLNTYEVVIYGGGLYATGIYGFRRFLKHIYNGQKLFVYATGAAPGRISVLKEIFDANLKNLNPDEFKFYYLRGGFDFKKLSFFDKVLMLLLKSKLKRKKKLNKPLNGDEKGMLKAYEKPVNFSKEKFIAPLVEDVKKVL
ncbi:MAG: flavodoxin domain-containing protein [Candidatus Izemoplasmataceae bacterium]|jgi:menaquinone-dependent protoporphyrinogen IX oxidase